MRNTSINIENLEEEKILVQRRNCEINQRLLRIVESRDAPFTDYVSQILNEKLKHVFENLNEIKNVMRSEDLRNKGRTGGKVKQFISDGLHEEN